MINNNQLEASIKRFSELFLDNENIPLDIKNKDRSHFLGLDIESLIRKSIAHKGALHFVDIRKSGNKVNIKFRFRSQNPHELKVGLKEDTNGNYFLDMVIGGKAVRIGAKIKHIDDDRFRLFFQKLGQALNVIYEKYELNNEEFSFSNRKEIIRLLDSIGKLLIS